MSGQNCSRLNKSSPNSVKQGPLKATIPISSVMKNSGNLKSPSGNNAYFRKNGSSPEHASGQRSPGSAGYKGKPKAASATNCTMRRTASMDAIYLKGHWPRDGFRWSMGTLHVNEATQVDSAIYILIRASQQMVLQTDESCLSDLRQIHCISEIDRRQDRPSARSRVWSTKDPKGSLSVGGGGGGENTLNTSSQTVSTYYSPPMPKPLTKPSIRSSVEGLNQEIERLVLKTDGETHACRSFEDRYSETIPEGHRAPVADLFKFAARSRSVDTQTPQNFGNSSHSSGESQGSSPDQETSKLGSSPQINRFLAREPPDGCEKVLSKSLTENRLPALEHAPQPTTFKLQPSSGSAFQILRPIRTNVSDQDLPIVPSADDD
ncbi:unnamed protein product [Phyllotreta striolata]|uniref:Uncharacterized protein n=1 Tax=Phyllotreta striolata TaxID=444603 RepID=A0A9N9XRR1_PHYSR|nr:unnamed protein product [Phyllotreta striolata]